MSELGKFKQILGDNELEAKEACDWLRAAGFPQYAQLYEGALFPIDISSVRKDHGFLDQDSLKSLCRRLTTLNKCAAMRLEVHFQSKQSEDSEEDEVCAISDRWAFQRESKTWSRLRPLSPTLRASASSESVLSDFSDLEVTSVNSATSVTSALSASSLSLDSIAREMTSAAVATSEPSLLPSLEVLRHKEEEEREKESGREKEGGREKAKRSSSRSFLRRMESLRRRDLREKETASAGISTVTQPTALDAMVTVECLHGNRHSRTWDGSLPGLSHTHAPTHTPSTMPGAWKAHTICRTSVDRSEAPLRPPRRSCLYLEDYQLVWDPKPSKHNCRLGKGWEEGRVVRLPSDHKPGTFPRSLSIESLCPTSLSHDSEQTGWPPGEEDPDFSLGGGCNSCSESQDFSPTAFQNRRNSCSSVGSVYDNVPEMEEEEIFNPDGEMDGETNGEMDGESKAFQHLDDILQHVQGLQSNITQWSRSLSLDQPETTLPGSLSLDQPETTLPSSLHETTLPRMQWSRSLRLQDDTEDRSAAETTLPSSLHFEEHSMSDVGTTTASDYDSTGNSLNEGEGGGEMRERRDSGVGASLTRPSRKLRWHSFQNSHRPSATSASQEINRQSAAQLNLLQKFSLLRLTAIMERYCEHSKQGWSWTVPKFMKRSKVAKDYRDKQVFGVPPIIHVQRTGQPLPQSIQQAMRYLRSQCLEKVGIFRKSGVKSRIQALRQLNENSPDHVSYEGQSAYDVADLLKQYFRDLPEPVLTTKLTDTFLQIYQYVPVEQRLRAVQAAVILLPDESREVLQTFLYFLSDIVSAQENQMTAQTLAVCLAPSILHLNACKREGTSPRLISRRGGVKPDHKDLSENMAATQGLSHMITECKKLFQIPHEMMLQSRNSYVAADAQPLPLHGLGVNQLGEPVDYRAYLEDNIQCLLRESAEKSRGWHSAPGPHNTELAYKKVGDGHPIRLWRVVVEIEAPPPVVLQRILRERHLWDEDLLHSRVIESLESCTEVFHYITDSMAPQPRRHCIVLRRWCNDLPKGVCLLVSSSVDHGNVHLEAGLRAVLLTSRFLIEPCGMGRSRLTHYCRADLRGRSPEWYNKVFGHLCAVEAARIRGSFPVLMARGPETKL